MTPCCVVSSNDSAHHASGDQSKIQIALGDDGRRTNPSPTPPGILEQSDYNAGKDKRSLLRLAKQEDRIQYPAANSNDSTTATSQNAQLTVK